MPSPQPRSLVHPTALRRLSDRARLPASTGWSKATLSSMRIRQGAASQGDPAICRVSTRRRPQSEWATNLNFRHLLQRPRLNDANSRGRVGASCQSLTLAVKIATHGAPRWRSPRGALPRGEESSLFAAGSASPAPKTPGLTLAHHLTSPPQQVIGPTSKKSGWRAAGLLFQWPQIMLKTTRELLDLQQDGNRDTSLLVLLGPSPRSCANQCVLRT